MTFEEFRREWFDSSTVICANTSGSTGIPKPVKLLKSDMELSARATCRRFGINASSLLAIPLGMDYIAGKMMAVRSFVSGARLVVLPPSRRPLDGYSGDTIDLLAIVPSQIDGLLDGDRVSCVRNVIVGGAPMSADQERRLLNAGLNVFATYGMTETCSHVALRPGGTDVYQAMSGITFDVDGDGCLIIDTGEMSVGRIVTRDIVTLLSPTQFRWIGRADNCINSGGVKIFPETVERQLSAVIPDRVFYITSRASSEWGQEVVMVITDDHPFTPDERAAIDAALPRYSRPKAIIYDNAPELTRSGKLRRRRF